MSKTSFIPILCLVAGVAGCDSQSQLTASRSSVPTLAAQAATESISSFNGGATQISYQFAAASLPTAIASGNNLAVVLGGHVAPLLAQGPLLVASLPPQTLPPVPDGNGDVPLLVQSDKGSAIVIFKVTATLPQIFGPNATLSATPGGSH